ncbi:MAG: neutral/alkaline non-lysosomal ceramidase N-terminal domain-containing protein [Leadbetterella sp.]
MRILAKYLGYSLLTIVVLVLLFAACSIVRLPREPYASKPHYQEWKKIIENVDLSNENPLDSVTNLPTVGWNKVNITPVYSTPMAGYGKRRGKHFESVHDSVYCRSICISQNKRSYFWVSADMLIIPPSIYKNLGIVLEKNNIDIKNVYFSASHSHNSVGGWGNTLTGELFAGEYNPAIESFLTQKIAACILGSQDTQPLSDISYAEVRDSSHIHNRLPNVPKPRIDPEVRFMKFTKKNGQTATLLSYGAHNTVVNSATMQLSRDYCGEWVDLVEKNNSNFALYMAGAVGSMAPEEKGKDDWEEVRNQAQGLHKAMDYRKLKKVEGNQNWVKTIALPMPDPTPRIAQNWALRPWVFRWLFGDYPTHIQVARIGNVLQVGLPCDFSGELVKALDDYASKKGLTLIVTSFNGAYVGYVTADERYDLPLYETSTMSWYGPYMGAYFSEVVRDVIDKVTKESTN